VGAVDNRQARKEAFPAMDKNPRLLILWHSRTGASEALARAAAEGAGAAAWLVNAGEAEPDMLLAADGYIFVCPENLGSMSGLMKEAFDRAYYPLLGKVEGRAYATMIAAGSDGEGAQRQIDRIVTGWRLKRVAPPVIVNLAAQIPEAINAPKAVPEAALVQARDTGAAIAEGLRLGLF
jgi:multimeric flavodoxin WrbA